MYSPDLSVEDWVELLKDDKVFRPASLMMMKQFLDYGGEATCKQLSKKYGKSVQFYISSSAGLAKRIADETNCPVPYEGWWQILYLGRGAEQGEDGEFVWRLRDELAKALTRVDLDDVPLYASEELRQKNRFWWLKVSIEDEDFDDLKNGANYAFGIDSDNDGQPSQKQIADVEVDDRVYIFEGQTCNQLVAIAKIFEKENDEIYIKIVDKLNNPIDYDTLMNCPGLENVKLWNDSEEELFAITESENKAIMNLIRKNDTSYEKRFRKYTKSDFLKEVYMSKNQYDKLVLMLENKKNIILQGAPGVGKTFTAKRLAYSMMGVKDDRRIEFVQFHQNYPYEDFMMGYKPVDDGFELKQGIFYNFCKKALA